MIRFPIAAPFVRGGGNNQGDNIEIQAVTDVRKAFAVAIGDMLGQAKMQIFGDPTTLSNMAGKFMNAAAWGQTVDGMRPALPPDVEQLATRVIGGTGGALAAALKKVTGHDVDPAVIEEAIQKVIASRVEEGNGKPASTPKAAKPNSKGKPKKS